MYYGQIRALRKFILDENIRSMGQIALLSDGEVEEIIRNNFVLCVTYDGFCNGDSETIVLVPKEQFDKCKVLER